MSAETTSRPRATRTTVVPRTLALAAAADAAGVVVFAAVGRSSHAEGVTLGGLATTAWPFLAGTAVGWALARAPREPLALPTGAVVVAGAVVLGMALRFLAGQGTAVSFVVVTAVVLTAFLLGWRGVVRLALRRAGRRAGRRRG